MWEVDCPFTCMAIGSVHKVVNFPGNGGSLGAFALTIEWKKGSVSNSQKFMAVALPKFTVFPGSYLENKNVGFFFLSVKPAVCCQLKLHTVLNCITQCTLYIKVH